MSVADDHFFEAPGHDCKDRVCSVSIIAFKLLRVNFYNAGLCKIDISTEVCTLQWIYQQPIMIKQCFNVLNTLPNTGESVCNIRLGLH